MYNGAATLSWTPNTEPDLAGYTVYAGIASRVYTQTFLTTGVQQFINGLAHDSHWYFTVTARDQTGNESTYSAEVHKHIILSTLNVLRRVTQ